MLDVELFGAPLAPGAPPPEEIRRLCVLAPPPAGVEEGHVAIEFVDAQRIGELNERHRAHAGPTDVLSFPIDGADPSGGAARELGDVVICEAHTSDLREAIVHRVLHLVGMAHETDDGEMLALQRELLARRAN